MKTAEITGTHFCLDALTAADLMTRNPISISATANLREALALLKNRKISGAPVIDAAGRPVGVVSQSDILVHDYEQVDYRCPRPADERDADLPEGFHVEPGDPTIVSDIMTPMVFSVTPETGVATVVEEMLTLHVHRLFVVDRSRVLVGVISATDFLRRLRPTFGRGE